MPAKKKQTFVKIGIANIPFKNIVSWRYENKIEPIFEMNDPPKFKQIGTVIVPTFHILLKGEKTEGRLTGDAAIEAKKMLESI